MTSHQSFPAPSGEQVQAHTPGPWAIVEEQERPWRIEVVSAGGSVLLAQDRMTFASKQETLADNMSGRYMGTPTEQREAARVGALQMANLRLIAAAPALLAALQAICATASDLSEDVLCEFANDKSDPTAAEEARAMLAARAAIARATS
jgi:hypothetical protein